VSKYGLWPLEEETMTASVLVAYATKYGSTQEVAEAVATTLREHGFQTEVQPAREVSTLDSYSAVVLGAALYMGRWHKDARSFLKRHRTGLAGLPVAIFALGPLTTAEKERQGSRAQLDRELARTSWLAPVSIEVFGGVINPAKLHFPFNHMPAGDARDWTAIRAWASKLVALFRPEPAGQVADTLASIG
jgi:menaquinone-dependent protoporphyrinogen oxidase